MSLEAAPTQLQDGDSQPLDVLPIRNQTKNMFDCFYPTTEPTIKRIQESVSFPTHMMDVLTYAVGYVHQGATASRAKEQQHEILLKRYQAAEERISGDLVVLEKLRNQTESQDARILELEDMLTVQKRFSQRLQRGLDKLRSGEGSAGDVETPELMETREKLELATAREKEVKDKYDAVQKENADVKSKLAVENNKNADLEEYKKRLDTSMATQVQELLTLRKKLAQMSADFAEAKHHIDVDGHIIAGIQDERCALKKVIREKTQEVDDVKRECAAARKSLKAELDETRARLEIVEDEKQSVEEKLQDCEARLKAAEAAKKAVEEEHQACEARLKAVEAAKKSIEEEHQVCGARLKAAEEANKSLEEKLKSIQAELEEAKKPVLENNVVLKNPIAIAGSLKGAPKLIDDEMFPVPPLPFAVTIYGHSSTKLFVTDNGVLCFDEGIKDPRGKREGQKLPHYDGVPPYSLFPFWTDLMLAKGKPHGIFYEIEGATGARTVTFEWYVTRYNHEEQYFQFTVLLEEAKPNIVTFRYYDALDKGKECTIGVQGPSSCMMFSHNQPKVFPGLQIVFDTKANKMVQSTFHVK
jgi:hypothetical protein